MKKSIVPVKIIQSKILSIKGQKVILAKHLAELYGVETRRLNEQVKRNKDKFPEHFMFQLKDEDADFLVSQNAIPSKSFFGGHLPYVFTEYGVIQAANVLNSKLAVQMSIHIIEAFIRMKQMLGGIFQVKEQLDILKKTIDGYAKSLNKIEDHDKKIAELEQLINVIIDKMLPDSDELVIKGFTGQEKKKK